jgi:hypothetical protein
MCDDSLPLILKRLKLNQGLYLMDEAGLREIYFGEILFRSDGSESLFTHLWIISIADRQVHSIPLLKCGLFSKMRDHRFDPISILQSTWVILSFFNTLTYGEIFV